MATAYGFTNDSERYSGVLELIRACFGREEFDLETARTFAKSVTRDQKLFLDFALSVLSGDETAVMVTNWHMVRSVLGCIPETYNWDSKLELGESIGNF